jgi:hypothetical protein
VTTRSADSSHAPNRLNFFYIDSTNSQQHEQCNQQQQQRQQHEHDLPRYEDIIQPANDQIENTNNEQQNSLNLDVNLNLRQSEPPSYDDLQRYAK